MTADAEYGVKYAQERVITLPQDQGQWYVSIFGDSADSQFKKLQQWFETHPGLDNLRGQVHFNVYSLNSIRYRRYAKDMPGLPCVRVQNSKGGVISEFWADYIPLTSESLYNGIRGDLQDEASGGKWVDRRDHRLHRRCPGPHPCPNPAPGPVIVPTPVDDPPVLEPEPEPKAGFPWLLALVAAIAGGGIGVGTGFKKEHIDAPMPVGPKSP
jgi:hypothetical protein